MMNNDSNEIEIIQPEEAAAILDPKIVEFEAEGWVLLVRHDYMARLTRGKSNLDIQIDLLGEVLIEEKPITLAQESGRIIAIVLVIVFLFLAMTIASVLKLI